MTGEELHAQSLFHLESRYVPLSSLLAMNILSLGMVLVKRVSDRAAKALRKEAKARKKSSQDLTAAEDAEDRDQESPEEAAARAKNAREQVAALLSFKDAFCSGGLFASAQFCLSVDLTWRSLRRPVHGGADERVQGLLGAGAGRQRRGEQDRGRHLLLLPAVSRWTVASRITDVLTTSTTAPQTHSVHQRPPELVHRGRDLHQQHRAQPVHCADAGEDRASVAATRADLSLLPLPPHAQQILSVIPGICSDLGRPYHNDWLGDIILITYYAIRCGLRPLSTTYVALTV